MKTINCLTEATGDACAYQDSSSLYVQPYTFVSSTGIRIDRSESNLDPESIEHLIGQLNQQQGMYLGSGVADRSRYRRRSVAFLNPPLELIGHGRHLAINALNPKGEALLFMLAPLVSAPDIEVIEQDTRHLRLMVPQSEAFFAEEMRSLQPSVLTPVRRIIQAFFGIADNCLGLYGAFGYDLAFQFEKIRQEHARPASYKNLHLFLPDEIYVLEPDQSRGVKRSYEFYFGNLSTVSASRTPFTTLTEQKLQAGSKKISISSNISDKEYADLVDRARAYMQTGDVFELVLHRRFSTECTQPPAALFRHLRAINPSPYEFLLQMGDEQLVSTSPEMFVRVEGRRVESSPVSGTIRRGSNAMEDADRILSLLNSKKDETELNMCTDVDRNDKARVCQPGSVMLVGRRLIELYTGLIHTADHVEGMLRDDLSGIDAFLSHMWAVTLTGAPKRKAMQLIEEMEREPRAWYGGAVGAMLMNGDIDTGITIRTAHIQDGKIHYRAGASLVYDSIGAEEEQETRTKANAFFRAIEALQPAQPKANRQQATKYSSFSGKPRIVLLDYEDSFVHTLADYFRQANAEVTTYRHEISTAQLVAMKPDLVVHSPGPGKPCEFGLPGRVLALANAGIPQFGVCLGLQGIAEAFGGRLGQLEHPRQGKRWKITHTGNEMFTGVPSPCTVGAYHALYARREALPEELVVTAENEDGLVMALRHRYLPIEAVQFHPESILSMESDAGITMIRNVVQNLQAAIAEISGLGANSPVQAVS